MWLGVMMSSFALPRAPLRAFPTPTAAPDGTCKRWGQRLPRGSPCHHGDYDPGTTGGPVVLQLIPVL